MNSVRLFAMAMRLRLSNRAQRTSSPMTGLGVPGDPSAIARATASWRGVARPSRQ